MDFFNSHSSELIERYIEWHKHIKDKYDPYKARYYYNDESMFRYMQNSLGIIHTLDTRNIRKAYRRNSLERRMVDRVIRDLDNE